MSVGCIRGVHRVGEDAMAEATLTDVSMDASVDVLIDASTPEADVVRVDVLNEPEISTPDVLIDSGPVWTYYLVLAEQLEVDVSRLAGDGTRAFQLLCPGGTDLVVGLTGRGGGRLGQDHNVHWVQTQCGILLPDGGVRNRSPAVLNQTSGAGDLPMNRTEALQFTDQCSEGTIVVGLYGRNELTPEGGHVARLGLECARLDAWVDSSVMNPPFERTTLEGSELSGAMYRDCEARCPRSYVMTAVRGGEGYFVDRVRLVCTRVTRTMEAADL